MSGAVVVVTEGWGVTLGTVGVECVQAKLPVGAPPHARRHTQEEKEMRKADAKVGYETMNEWQ